MGTVLDLLLPPRCAACGGAGWPLCQACTQHVGVAVPPLCRRCGRPAPERLSRCVDCPPRVIDAARAPFLYDGPVAAAIRGMKFSGWRALAPHLGAAMAGAAGPDASQADAVTWVPLSSRRRARRGFDQAELLAGSAAGHLRLPLIRLLRRDRDTAAQARRSGADRRHALAGAFAVLHAPPPRVLLVDDVLTTGATAAACAGALKRAGAVRVDVLVAARSVTGPVPPGCYGEPRVEGHTGAR